MPQGWEKKVDSTSGQIYYIDHARRATQWSDPRLRHPSIWREQQRQMLDRLSTIFKDAPEDTLRQALITCRFMEFNAVNHVANLGYKKSASVVVGQQVSSPEYPGSGQASASASAGPPAPSGPARSPASPPMANGDFPTVARARKSSSPRVRSTAASPKPRVRTSSTSENRPGVDPFTLLTMKSRFPETTEDVIVDVLNQCGQNVDMASRELTNMGYAGRQRAAERAIEPEFKSDASGKDKKQRQKADRDRSMGQLKNEFESFLDADIKNAFESCSYDLYETRNALRRREADNRMEEMNTHEVQATAMVPVVTVQESTTTTTIGDTTVTIERRRPSLDEAPAGNVLVETVKIKTSKSQVKKSNDTQGMKTLKLDFADRDHYESSKSTGASPLHRSSGNWMSLAKGPDPNLRRGSDPNLRGGITRALGPDPSLRRGPNPQYRNSVIGNQVALAAVQ